MIAAPHPDFPRLVACCHRLANDAAKPCTGVGFRFALLKYGHPEDLLSGRGAKMAGGRVNSIDTFRVIYTSTDPATATAETFQNFADFGFVKANVRPRVMVGVAIHLATVLDLCDPAIRRRLGVILPDLLKPWWPVQEAGGEALTQAIGRAAYDAGFEGIAMPSARRKMGVNLNVFPEKIRAGSSIVILAAHDLREYLK